MVSFDDAGSESPRVNGAFDSEMQAERKKEEHRRL